MKTERRHELQTNVLADWLGVKIEAAQQYTKAIVASLLAVVVIGGVLLFLIKRSEQKQAAAWGEFFNATSSGASEQLDTVADKYPDTLAGQWARLSLGDSELSQGVSQLFDDRTLAKGTLERAIDDYTRARQGAGEAEIQERAMIGLGRAHEALSQLAEARQQYEQLLAKWPKTIYATEARQRLDDLSRQSTKEFYDWFAVQNSKSFESGGPGVPGVKPSGLPEEEPAVSPSDKSNEKAEQPAAKPVTSGEKSKAEPKTPAVEKSATPPKTPAARPEPKPDDAGNKSAPPAGEKQ